MTHADTAAITATVTIGTDLGDPFNWYCARGADGKAVEVGHLTTSPAAIRGRWWT